MLWNWGGEWDWGPALRKYHTDLTASIDTVLLSRKMAEEGFVDHWETVSKKTNDPQAPFAKNITEARKIVFTRTLGKCPWKNTRLAITDLVQEVNALKDQPGKGMIAYGGASFASALIAARLVDELHLVVNPVVIGKGMAIFGKVGHPLRLSLLSAQSHDNGIVVLRYASL